MQRARELGSYRLVELIGRGGMGEVWRATHRMLARPAAIKLIKPELLGARTSTKPPASSSGSGARPRRRPACSRRTRSDLYDFGETRDGTFYFVMELLDGLDLETLVRRFGPLPPARVVVPPAPGLPLARRGARSRPDPPRRQAGQHLSLPARAGSTTS